MSERLIEIRRVRPDDEFSLHQVPHGMPFGPVRWVATTAEERHFFGYTRRGALRKARRYLRAIARAEASREVVE